MTDQAYFAEVIRSEAAQQAQDVIRGLLDDGVEFDKVRNCVLVWSNITRGIAFYRGGGGIGWVLERTKPGTMGLTICNNKGDPLFFRSFHELLQWLFDQPEIER